MKNFSELYILIITSYNSLNKKCAFKRDVGGKRASMNNIPLPMTELTHIKRSPLHTQRGPTAKGDAVT